IPQIIYEKLMTTQPQLTICPYFLVAAHRHRTETKFFNKNNYLLFHADCPACKHNVIILSVADTYYIDPVLEPESTKRPTDTRYTSIMLLPQHRKCPNVSKEVPLSIASDYVEAHNTITCSEKASAALSRRCLQSILTDQGFTKRDLIEQIKDAVQALPAELAS